MLNNAFLHAEDINFSLLTAIKTGNENRVREILDSLQRPILENIRDEEDYKPNLLIMGSHSPAIVVELLKAYPNISSCEKNLALIHAASRGCTQTIVEILTRCSDIKRSDQAASIICAAKCGQIQAFVELILRCWADLTHNDKEMVLFEISDYGEPLVELINRCGTEINSDLKGFTLRRAARNGNYQTIVELLARWNDEISNIDKGEALDNAASRGHSQVIREILNRCDAEIESEDKAFALIHAVECVHLNALNTLLAYPSVEEVANYDNNQALTEALTRADSNSGYRLQYQLIVDRLMQIPAVANLTAQQSQQAMIDLSYITQFAENSMQALSAKELDIVSHLKNHYKAIYEDKGYEVIRSEILSYLEESYKKSPAFDNDNPLPLEYTANLSQTALQSYYKHLNHGAWRYLSDSNSWMSVSAEYVQTLKDGKKVAIISDEDKELLSYIWIALNDETVKLDEGFTVECNKNVFAQNIGEMNRAHNHNERSKNPLEQQAYEESVPGIQTTTADDFEADKPTCAYGVTKRLLQNPYGHPLIKPLDPKIMQNWMEALLFRRKEKAKHVDNITDKLDKLSLKELENLQENLLESTIGEEFTCHPVLQITEMQLSTFIEKVKTWYGIDEITLTRNPKLTLRDLGKAFTADSYLDLIESGAKDPMRFFATELNVYLRDRIKRLQHANTMQNIKPITPSYDDSKEREHDDKPDTGVKFRLNV